MIALPLWLTAFLRSGLRIIRRTRNTVRMWCKRLSDRGTDKPVVVVLSLDKLGPSHEVSRQAWLKGFRVHVFAPTFPVLDAAHAHDWSKIDPRTDFDAALEIARDVKPVAVLLESKNLLLPMQNYLANELNLKSTGDKAVETSNSKIALRRSLDEHGVPNVPWMPLEDFGHDTDFPFPGVIKPDRGTASKGVRFVALTAEVFRDGGDRIDRALKDPSVGERMLLEGFVKGRQFDLEGVAVDGEYHLFCIVEEFYEAAPPYFPPAWFHFNPPISQRDQDVLWSTTKKALKALGVQNGGFHLEQRLDASGTSRAIDYANRMGYNHLISAASGVSIAGCYVDLMTGRTKDIARFKPRSLLQIFAFDDDTLRRMRRFVADHPQHVHSRSFYSYEFSFHLYLGYLVVTFDTFAQQQRLLQEYGLEPKEFAGFYPSAASQDAAE